MEKKTISVFAFIAGLTIGGASSYFLTKKVLQKEFDLELQEQIDDVKHYYKDLRKKNEVPATSRVENTEFVEALKSYQFEEPQDPANEEIQKNIDTDEPTIISLEEFMEERTDLDKITLTYYEGDDVLCDDRDVAIHEFEKSIGNEALTKFGHLSKDPNVVYVRNEKNETDYEIIKDHRSFSEAVLGIREEKEVHRMREDD